MQTTIKTLLFGVGLMSLTSVAHAQSSVRFGIRGGLNVATQEQHVNGNSIENDNLTGFHAGLVAEIPLTDDFSVRPELLFSRKGLKYTASILGQSVSYTDKLSYITVPVSLTYRVQAGPAALVLGAGPYAGLLVNAKREGTARILGASFTRSGELRIGSDDDNDYKAVDAGLNFQGLVEVDRFFVGAHYGLGLINALPFGDDDTYRRNRGWEFTLGAYLSK